MAVWLKPICANWVMKVAIGFCGRGVLVANPVPPAVASILPVLIGTSGPPQERTDAYTPSEKRSAIDDLLLKNGAMLVMVSVNPWPILFVGAASSKINDPSKPPVPVWTQAVAMSWKAVRSHSAEFALPG